MSLDWDISKCPHPTEWYHSDAQWPFTQAVIFACIPVGIGKITVNNYKLFTMRWNMWNRLSYGPDEKIIGEESVKDYVGLHTNVFPEMSEAAFARNMMRVLKEMVQREMRRKAS